MFSYLQRSFYLVFTAHLLMWTIVIDAQIVLINFFILNIIYESIIIVYFSRVPVHVQIKCLMECSPFLKSLLENF
jgi:hypothetical protein